MTPDRIRALVELAVALLLLAVAFGAGWYVENKRAAAEVATLKGEYAAADSKAAKEALATLVTDAKAIHDAAGELGQIQLDIGPKFDALKREIKNAKPLPVGCAPDVVRVRNLDAAIDTANAAIARAGARGTVPPNP